MDKAPKKKTVSVNFWRALFSLFDYLTLEDGTNGMSQNVSAENKSLGDASLGVCLHGLVQSDLVWLDPFGPSYVNFR